MNDQKDTEFYDYQDFMTPEEIAFIRMVSRKALVEEKLQSLRDTYHKPWEAVPTEWDALQQELVHLQYILEQFP